MWTLAGFADEISPDLDAQCSTLTQLDVGYVEFRSAWDVGVLDLDDAQLERVRRTLDQNGLRVSSVGSPIGKIGIGDDFDQHLRRFDRALHVADLLSAPYIRVFSFFIPAGDAASRHREQVIRRMAALADRADGHDVVLLHENEKNIYGDTPQRCLDVVESVGSERLRLTWDPANFVQCGVRPYTDGFEMLRPYLEYIQIKDAIASTGQVVPAGAGDGQLSETITALRDDGFDGFFSLEPHLASAGVAGGFSGADLFAAAHTAFVGLLRAASIDYR
jgi:sugar phosphate isomerase/epimerase